MTPPQLPPDLLAVLAASEQPAIARILMDLLSPNELRALGERWAIVKGLAAGETQRDLSERLGVAIATVSRGARQLRYGTGGFAQAFDTLTAVGHPDPRAVRR